MPWFFLGGVFILTPPRICSQHYKKVHWFFFDNKTDEFDKFSGFSTTTFALSNIINNEIIVAYISIILFAIHFEHRIILKIIT